ncbi:MAG: hypothetical protein MO847_12235 [Candidatus Protistobacter heckmanni]|nr:hypothetical protein [Candidatus Protistobacter heckmanni]
MNLSLVEILQLVTSSGMLAVAAGVWKWVLQLERRGATIEGRLDPAVKSR